VKKWVSLAHRPVECALFRNSDKEAWGVLVADVLA